MNKSLVLALFLGAVKPDQVFENPQDLTPTEAEAFMLGYNEAMGDEQDELDNKPYANEGLMFEYVQNNMDVTEDTTEMWGNQACTGGIQRWSTSSNSAHTYRLKYGNTEPWSDPAFGADASSLYWNGKGMAKSFAGSYQHITTWKRPREITPGQGMTMYGSDSGPVPNGIKQGSLGDCWFLAAIAAVAEEPARITRLIANHSQYPKSGIFRFNFWVKDKWVGMNIDDRLPARKWGQGFHTFATSRSMDGGWWVPLMEKAYAKLDQNYDRIVGGSGNEGLKTLTSMPVQRYSFGKMNAADAWNRFSTYSGRNFPMTTPCCRVGNPHGLVSGHAYSFLGTATLSNGVKLAHVRNPWGSEQYKGPWSDHDSKWTAKFLQEAGHNHGNDGTFFMPFDYYYKYFYELNVAYYEPYKQVQVQNYRMAQKVFGFKINNPTNQEFYITVETLSSRNYPRSCVNQFNTFINTYLRNPSNQLVDGIGFVGNGLYHSTKGFYGQQSPAGTYDFQIYNWNWDKTQQVVEYSLAIHAKNGGVTLQKYK